MSKGPNTMMAKFDVANAYHIIHFHSDLGDRHLHVHAMERKALHRHSVTLWAPVSPKDFYGSGSHSTVDSVPGGGRLYAVPRRLYHLWAT